MKIARERTALTGGGSDALDGIPYKDCNDGDFTITIVGGKVYIHEFDASSTDSEVVPQVIAPDDVGSNPGRWILKAATDETHDLEGAVSLAGSEEKTITIATNVSISDNLTVPSNITLKFIYPGKITIPSGKTLTVNGALEAGLWQIFDGDGSVSFETGSVTEVYPEWFGAKGDGTTDDYNAIIKAINSVYDKNIPVKFLSKDGYVISGEIPARKVPLIGAPGYTLLLPTSSCSRLFKVGPPIGEGPEEADLTPIMNFKILVDDMPQNAVVIGSDNFVKAKVFKNLDVYDSTCPGRSKIISDNKYLFKFAKSDSGAAQFAYCRFEKVRAYYIQNVLHCYDLTQGTLNLFSSNTIIQLDTNVCYNQIKITGLENIFINCDLGLANDWADGDLIATIIGYDNVFIGGIFDGLTTSTPTCIRTMPNNSFINMYNLENARGDAIRVVDSNDNGVDRISGRTPLIIQNTSICGRSLSVPFGVENLIVNPHWEMYRISGSSVSSPADGAEVFEGWKTINDDGTATWGLSLTSVSGAFTYNVLEFSVTDAPNSGYVGLKQLLTQDFELKADIFQSIQHCTFAIIARVTDGDGSLTLYLNPTERDVTLDSDWKVYKISTTPSSPIEVGFKKNTVGTIQIMCVMFYPGDWPELYLLPNIKHYHRSAEALKYGVIFIGNKAHYYGTAAPTSGTWNQGDIVWNTQPSAGGNIGWVCVAGGSPGTWKTFGNISS